MGGFVYGRDSRTSVYNRRSCGSYRCNVQNIEQCGTQVSGITRQIEYLRSITEINDILKRIQALGVIPVVVLNDAKDAEPLAKALCEGGLPCAEITFRTDTAEESIRIMSEKFPEILVGAEAVLTTQQVDRAVAAGAKFIVSPGLNPRIVRYCTEKGVVIIPGCCNTSDIEQALENGIDVVKFFPAEAAGGLKMIGKMYLSPARSTAETMKAPAGS